MWFECAKMKRLMTEYADGRLSGKAKGTFESHMEVCPVCRKEYEEAREIRALFVSAPKFSAPAGFSGRVMRNLDSGRLKERRSFLLGVVPVMLMRTVQAALILVVIAAGIISGNFLGADLFPVAQDTGVPTSRGTTGMPLSYSIEAFDPAFPESVGAAFVVTEDRNEK